MNESPEVSEAEQSAGTERGERSATRYPFYNLEESEKFARAVLETGGNEVKEDDLLAHLKVSRTTKSWIYKLSSAREFGLIERKGQKDDAKILLTDLAKRLLRPADNNELIATRAASFLTPPLYKKLFEKYRGAPVPQLEFLAGYLVREHKLVESVKETAATAFIESAKFAGLVNGNVLDEPKKPGAAAPAGVPVKPQDDPGNYEQEVRVPGPFIPHVFQLRRNMKIIVPLPPDLTVKDVDRIHKWMQTLPIDDEEGGVG